MPSLYCSPATVEKDNTYKLSAISPAAWTSADDDTDTCVCPTVVPVPPAKKKPVVVAVPKPPIEITFPIKPIKVVPAPPVSTQPQEGRPCL